MPDQLPPPALASAADLLAARPKRRHKDLVLPVLGLPVRIRSLSESELAAYNMAVISTKGSAELRRARMQDAARRLICLVLVDADGNRLLADADAEQLTGWDSADTQFLYQEAAAWVGLQRGDVEDLVKNSERMSGAA